MIDLIGRISHIFRRVNQLFEFHTAELVLTETGGTVTTDGTEQEIYRVEAPMGIYRPVKVMVDFSAQTMAETVILRTYYRISGPGGFVKKDEVSFIGTQDPDLKNIELEPNRHGIRVSIERIAGGAQDYPWEVFFED